MDDAGVCGANVFALNEPDREPAYRAPNDRVLAWAAEVPDRLFPFVRLSLDEDPLGEAERCLDRGARGIKLHPRAQAFTVNDPRLETVFALAHERKLPVLIHAGRGLPPGMPLQLGHVAERYPDASLILAHAAIVAQAGIGKLAQSVENIFFDSSTWTPLDQLNLLSLVPPEQILWASDIPYGEPLAALNVFAGAARLCGAGDELLRGMLRDNALGLLEGRRPATRSAPIAEPEFRTSYARVRATMYMAGATSLLWNAMPEHIGYLGMAEAALHEDGLEAAGRARALREGRVGRVGRHARARRAARHRRPRTGVAAAQPGPGRHGAGVSEIALALNGREWSGVAPAGATLAEVLREQVGLTGTKIACAEGTCGACTVLVDGRSVLSCILLAEQADGCEVVTIEGLGDEGALTTLQRAFVEEDALQCGFCTAGQIVSATALLAAHAAADERAGAPGDERQPLPLRRLSRHRARDPARRRGAGGERALMAKLQKTSVEMEGRFEERWVLVEEEPPAWEDDRELSVAGTRVPRLTGPRRVSGAARYVSDIALPAHALRRRRALAARPRDGRAGRRRRARGAGRARRALGRGRRGQAGQAADLPERARLRRRARRGARLRGRGLGARGRRRARAALCGARLRRRPRARRSRSSGCRRIRSRTRPATSRPAWPRPT